MAGIAMLFDVRVHPLLFDWEEGVLSFEGNKDSETREQGFHQKNDPVTCQLVSSFLNLKNSKT